MIVGDASRDPEAAVEQDGAWREWLDALSRDADAALAAALLYAELDDAGRNAWIEALVADALALDVPLFAVLAPLLSVEADESRRRRLLELVGGAETASATRHSRCLAGCRSDGASVAVIVTRLYLDFVSVLSVGFSAQGISWVRYDPLTPEREAPRADSLLDDVVLEPLPAAHLIELLAEAVWAHTRAGGELPEALRLHAELFQLE